MELPLPWGKSRSTSASNSSNLEELSSDSDIEVRTVVAFNEVDKTGSVGEDHAETQEPAAGSSRIEESNSVEGRPHHSLTRVLELSAYKKI
jgi:hypothetical protein